MGGPSCSSCLVWFELPLAGPPWFTAFFFISLPSSFGIIGVMRPDLLDLALACDGGVRGRVSLPVVVSGSPLLALDDG